MIEDIAKLQSIVIPGVGASPDLLVAQTENCIITGVKCTGKIVGKKMNLNELNKDIFIKSSLSLNNFYLIKK